MFPSIPFHLLTHSVEWKPSSNPGDPQMVCNDVEFPRSINCLNWFKLDGGEGKLTLCFFAQPSSDYSSRASQKAVTY